jgi:hypothetical protein
MTTQATLFDLPPVAPASILEPERGRLSSQNERILAILRRGPVSNDDLSRIARKYTSRLSDLRKAGYDVRVKSRDHKTGLVVYELVEAQ